ncbi:MAG: hypothetical protein VX971_00165 [Actinomycetota bacterium]|nr:hypothetical protein [Acidimicrobiales bacterium]MEC7874944.1 hypothetical protein [Actinomycetota bacterium]MEC8828994.1 hypothetical protein [Actinomycetota bacterium]MEC8975348.1 hypothetical protein [Actinomycetota bacterium]MEC9338031.1 hypothetical protein [Actinomycetota bacterium]|tara:strand:- start:5494 stop:5865 length:372 start_codon:yes stop_codon:yes gene_type:complete
MQLVWIRTQEGETVIEDLEMPSTQQVRGYETTIVPLNGAIFRTQQPAVAMDFHNAPRRQIVVPLEGEVEIEVGSGEVRLISPGMALLADDLSGQGHKSTFRPENATTLFLLLPDDLDPAVWRK